MGAALQIQDPATRGGRRWAALAVLCVAQFVDVLGVTIVIIALPAIGRDLGLAERDLQWVASIYALCFGGFLLLAGRAADLFGRQRLFTIGLALFTVASLACGLAGTPALLLVARALQGLGAAVAVPAALSLLTTTFTDSSERARALGVWTAAAAGGGVTGYVLGGVLTGTLGWHWVFLVKVPVGALVLVLAPVVLVDRRERAVGRRLDVAGAVTGTAGLMLLVFGFTRAEHAGFATAGTLGTLALAIALLAGFWLVEGRVTDPLVPHRVLRSRELAGANLAAFTLTSVTSPAGVIGSLYLQQALGYRPTATALALLPFSLSAIAGSFAGAWLTGRLRARATMALGLVAVTVAMLLLSRIPVRGGLPLLVAGVVIAGLGLTCASVASTASGTAAAAGDVQGLASGLLNTAAQIGTALGIAALVTVAAARTSALAGAADPTTAQFVEGFRLAFLAAALVALLGTLGTQLLVRGRPRSATASGRQYPRPTMTYSTDPRVDAYIGALPDWQQAICREVRDLVHSADPDVAETIKFTNRPYFVLDGNICALLAAKDHVNVFLYDGAIVPDPEGIITGGHENTTARTVAIRQGETINAPALAAMFRQIIANNRAGGWRKLKHEMPQ